MEVRSYSELFLQNTPDDVLMDWGAGLVDAYKKAHLRSKEEFNPRIARWHRPFLRRAIIEQRLVNSAESFKGKISASIEDDDSKFWTHTVITCNSRFALTQSTAKDSDYVIRRSEFRKQRAKANSQQLMAFLAEPAKAEAAIADGLLYAILLHGRDPSSVGKLGFVTVRFPKPDLTGYYEEEISLFKRFPALVALARAVTFDDTEAVEEENVGDLPNIDLNEQDEVG